MHSGVREAVRILGVDPGSRAAGVAVMMEAVRILQAIGAEPARTIRIGLWSGEEQGLMGSRAWVEQHATLLDLSTPFLADAAGSFELDFDLFLAAHPAAFRPFGRWYVPKLVRRWLDLRHCLLDFAANLHKERLEAWVPVVLDEINRVVDPPISVDETRRFYRVETRLWPLFHRLKTADRWWQRQVRHRTYQFLLPERSSYEV